MSFVALHIVQTGLVSHQSLLWNTFNIKQTNKKQRKKIRSSMSHVCFDYALSFESLLGVKPLKNSQIVSLLQMAMHSLQHSFKSWF